MQVILFGGACHTLGVNQPVQVAPVFNYLLTSQY